MPQEPMPQPVITPEKRIVAIDAARGCAMVLVCASHIKHHFESSAPALTEWLGAVTRIATPTFLLLSGIVIAFLLRTDRRGAVGLSLIDRALFLLIVAHALLGLAELPRVGFVQWYFGRAMITDAIGVALFIAVLLRAASAATLLITGAALCLASWIVVTTISFHSQWSQLVGSVLFSVRSAGDDWISLPLVPYLGLFLIGMGLSVWLQPALQAGTKDLIARRLLLIGGTAILAVLAANIAWRLGNDYLPAELRASNAILQTWQMLDPLRKDPPSPAYLTFCGGAGVLLLALFFHGRPRWLVRPITGKAAVIGQASLMAFVVQDWLFFVLPAAFGYDDISSVPFWLAYLGVCVAGLYLLASTWNRAHGNRLFTLGLRSLVRQRAHEPAACDNRAASSAAGARTHAASNRSTHSPTS